MCEDCGKEAVYEVSDPEGFEARQQCCPSHLVLAVNQVGQGSGEVCVEFL